MDERAIRLLEEIRDLHRDHLALYREAVRNQEASIRTQEEAVRMQRLVVRRLVPALVGLVLVALLAMLFVAP